MRFLPNQPLDEARRLRKLAAWYRDLAERAGNPAIWERRLLVAEDLEAEAVRIECNIGHYSSPASDD